MIDPRADDALVAAARAGDRDAFAQIVRRHEGRLRAVLARILTDPRDVDEALQDAFVAAWRGLPGFRGGAAVGTWLHRIGVNEALMRLRRNRPEAQPLALETTDPAAGPADQAETRELARFLAGRLAALDVDARLPLLLRDVAGLANAEVAAVLGISLAAAKSRIHRARLWLMAEVERWEDGASEERPPS